MLLAVFDWLQKHPAVLPTVAATISAIALAFTARSFRLNARATKVTLFNNIRQRIEDAGRRVEAAPEEPKKPTPDHYAFLNELEWLCHLVRQGDIPVRMFRPYYGEPFKGNVEDYRFVIEEERGHQPNAYADILWVEDRLAKKWYQLIPLPSRLIAQCWPAKREQLACATSTPAPSATNATPPALSEPATSTDHSTPTASD